MSEQKLPSPLLDGFVVGAPMSDHDGVRCCPALKENSEEKYIVKFISVPASQVQLEALLLTRAYANPAEAAEYFREVAESIEKEVQFLNSMAKLDGFLGTEGCQVVAMENGKLGYEVCILSKYRRTLQRHLRRNPITHLQAVNLGLDLCAALAIARRAGKLYVNLKPSNVFLAGGREFRIGDLGFISLDSLEYTSLPGKYRSPYSPPETIDDLKTLNTTVDTYAVGMILYQIYNEGALPAAPREPADPFPCPANADYEISAIIMKAVHPDPARRWKSPMEMGQALVTYMQRNTVNNVPITPPTGIPLNVEPEVKSPAAEDAQSVREETAVQEPAAAQQVPAAPEAASEAASETAPETAPEPVLPEPEILPEPEVEASAEPDLTDMEISGTEAYDEDLDFSIAFEETVSQPAPEPEPEPVPIVVRKRKTKAERRLKGLISTTIVLLILAALGCAGFWFYQNHYLVPIDTLTVDGTQSRLTVNIQTRADSKDLTVTCTDTYGNSMEQSVVDGSATFTDLLPDSLYRVEVHIAGFHQLTGQTAEIFTTDALTDVVSMSAVAGPEDGSILVNFTVDGPDAEEWTVTCTADGEEPMIQTFTGHSVTIKGLTVGKTYTITLGSVDGMELLGDYSLEYTAGKLILAENLSIVSCVDGNMTVRWDAPEGANVERWGVRCYNDDGHEEVLEISGTEIVFTGIQPENAYTVEVTAAGMTEPSRVSITANPLTITDVTVNTDTVGKISLEWTWDGQAPEGGWLLLYTLDGQTDQPSVVKCEKPGAVIENRIPGARYRFEIQAADSTSIFNNIHTVTCPNAGIYSNEGLTADKITAYLLKTPDAEDWTFESVGEDAVTDTFQGGDSISVVLKASDNFYLPEMDINVMYVIRDGNGNVLPKFISREVIDWKSLWYAGDYHIGELDVPSVPDAPGNYSLSIYFENLAVTVINFSIAG